MSCKPMNEWGTQMSRNIRKVLNDNPDLPVIVLAEQVGCDEFTSCFLEGVRAEVDWLLWPRDTDLWGLNDERIYYDEDDAVEDVAYGLFDHWWDGAVRHGLRQRANEPQDDALTRFCGFEGSDMSLYGMADKLARKLVRDAPWKQYVVIDAWA